MPQSTAAKISIITAVLVLASCGGGGGGSGAGPGPNPGGGFQPGPQPNSVALASDAGDFVGQGGSYRYSNLDAIITVQANGSQLSISVEGDEQWTGDFVLPDSFIELAAGTYSNLTRYPFHDAVVGGMSWDGESRGCNVLTGTLVIESVTYTGSALSEIDFTFEQYCENGSAAMRGDIHWDANDTTVPPGPVLPPPANLWAPADGVTPASGNYLYLESDSDDYVGSGQDYLYTEDTALISVSPAGNRLSVLVHGYERWTGDLQAMISLEHLEVGYYGSLQRYPFYNKAKGGFDWGGQGRGCNELNAWFVIDSVTYDGDTLTAIELRFEQRCVEGPGGALHGELRWDVNDSTGPPGPVFPPPSNLWSPEPGTTPADGNFVYIDSEDGDFVGGGLTWLYTEDDSLIIPEWDDARFSITVQGNERWGGDFEGMIGLGRLEAGYYGDLQEYPFHNPVKGGLSWSGDGRSCTGVDNWFVVDSVTYDGDDLKAIDLRFRQSCNVAGPGLHGAIHWEAKVLGPPGPVTPPPDLWAPAPGATPASGNYIYLQSQPGDFIGAGNTYTYTLADSQISAEIVNALFTISVNGDEWWNGEFQGKESLAQLEVGYYGDLQHILENDVDRGGLHWSGESRACSNIDGWFVVDDVTYNGTALSNIELRFEQSCNYGPALNGEIHWDVNDTTSPPGPVVPPPAGLWEPAPGATPDTGSYVYLESEPGDFVGQGSTYLYTAENDQIDVFTQNRTVIIDVNQGDSSGEFSAMNTLDRIEVGYYGDLQRSPFHNLSKGGMDWGHQSSGCNTLTGWFAVDSVTYNGATVSAIDLRFEQHCEGAEPALYGEIHWSE
ncbi:MAG: hypothetical protein ACR2QL_04490 [Woeseiaceae bacterium]